MTKCSHDVYGYLKPLRYHLPTDAAVTTTQIQCANCDKVGEAIVTLDWHEDIDSNELAALGAGETVSIVHTCNQGRTCKQFTRLVQHAHRKFGKSNYTSIHTDNTLAFTRIR
jgi:hypothetical protein